LSKLYLSNKELYIEILISKAQGKLTRKAEGMLYLIAKKAINKMYYKDYDDKMDCLQNGCLALFKNWYQFNELKGTNAFAYFSEVFKRGIALSWNQLHRPRGLKDGESVFHISIQRANEGEGFHGI
jgi:DNA-directed RNA polymerase specialized sigma subunit